MTKQLMQQPSLSPALADLAAAPHRATYRRLWRALQPEERQAAILEELRNDATPETRQLFDLLVAAALHFRPQSVAKWTERDLAKRLAELDLPSGSTFDIFLEDLHRAERVELMREYTAQLGIDAADGLPEEAVLLAPVAEQQARGAADYIYGKYPKDHAVVYLLYITLRGWGIGSGIAEWLRELVSQSRRPDEPLSTEDFTLAEGPVQSSPVPVEDTDQFTTVDRLLVRAVVDVAQGIDGALSEEQLDDLLDELIQLNSERHRTYFHAGYRDAVLKREAETELPAQNESRLQWYLAGFMSGLARVGRWETIASMFDAVAVVKDLGKTGQGPSHAAAPLLFEALCRSGRSTEAAAALSAETVINAPSLIGKLYDEGVRLLNADQAAEARGPLELLAQALAEVGSAASDDFALDVERRRAQCYRQIGEIQRAKRLLAKLLAEQNPGPDLQAMISTDLGLIEGGFRRLSEVQLPGAREKLGPFIDSIERGEAYFRDSAAAESKRAAHGRYCLALLALARENYEDAVNHLDFALSVFETEPDRYSKGGLLPNVRLYDAFAVCLALQEHRLANAANRIHDALGAGANLPAFLVQDVLDVLLHLGHHSEDLAQHIAEAILSTSAPGILDVLSTSAAAYASPQITEILRKRARDRSRGLSQQVVDHRRLLQFFRAQRGSEAMAEALDFLESAAEQGVARDDFLGILANPEEYDLVWEPNEVFASRLRMLESNGAYSDAAALLEGEIHRLLSGDRYDRAAEARDLLDRMAGYGVVPERTAELDARVESMEQQELPQQMAETSSGRQDVAVLFVGGDERQEADAAVLREEFAATHPHMKLDFEHPGWSGHWGTKLEKLKKKLPGYEGVVIMRFIRTEYGRQLRKAVGDIPWRGCSGSGRQSMRRSILEAEAAAQSYVTKRLFSEQNP